MKVLNHIYVLNGKRIKKYILIVISALFTAWIVFVQNFVQFPVFSTDKGPKAFYRGDQGVVLSFNIGWGDEKAEPIIDTLEKLNVKSAVFFLSGSWAERHPDLVERITKLDYEIGLLGYGYENYLDLNDEKIRRDLNKGAAAFRKLGIKEIKYVRSPTGHFDERFLKIAGRYKYNVVHWSVDSKDWKNPGKEVITQNVSKAEKGDIILLHASDSAKQTAVALPLILDSLKQKNLKVISLSKLIADAKVSTKDINK